MTTIVIIAKTLQIFKRNGVKDLIVCFLKIVQIISLRQFWKNKQHNLHRMLQNEYQN